MFERRSWMVLISGIWMIIYALMLRPDPSEIEGIEAIAIVLLIWPGYLLYQLVSYALFSKYKNEKAHGILVIIKMVLFIIQPLFIRYEISETIVALTILAVFLIDYHIMKSQNKVPFSERHLSKEEQDETFKMYKRAWFLIGPCVLLFALYQQFQEGYYTGVIGQSILYYFLFLRMQQNKLIFGSIQLCGLAIVYLITLLDTYELIRAILLITLLVIIYFANRFAYDREIIEVNNQIKEG